MSINCYAAKQAKAALEKFAYSPAELGPHDVEVRITHCGICHSDVHLIDNDWGISAYPLVPGHEIVGTVTAAGSAVRHLKFGERVGIGWQRSACLECEYCLRGKENLCPRQEATCAGHYGGFAETIRTDSRFAFLLPASLTPENAAPLLCGGITVFSPLARHTGAAALKVGIIGIGGLGHMALQFARAFGHEVTAFSSTAGKEKEAKEFGAHRFVSSLDPGAMKSLAATQDFLLVTAAGADLDWAGYLAILKPGGKLCFVGVPAQPISIPAFLLIAGEKTVCGSPIGSRKDMEIMLNFAAQHGIRARTESAPMADVNTALARVRANRARYRIVLKNPS